MITIIVGVPGAGKTLYAVSELRKEYKDATVYHYNIPEVSIEGWKELQNPEEWHKTPEGSVCIVDEAHEVFPKRDHRVKEPEHIEAAARLRHSGHHLVLITQHPVDLDIFLRRRCARFIYIKKPLTKGDYASVFVWGEYNENYKDEREQEKADTFQFNYPSDAYQLYKSASLHTGKRYVPKAAKRAAFVMLVGITVAVFAVMYGYNKISQAEITAASESVPQYSISPQNDSESYIKQYLPRIPSLPYTAPIYDGVVEAKTFPRLQCVSSATQCKCWTQQATRLYIDEAVCRKYVTDGIFDWTRKEGERRG